MPPFAPGHVWLCGAGPGDVGLLTLHGAHAIGQADVIVHDALIGADILALARSGCTLELMGKRGGQSDSQAGISARLIDLARSGKRVLRLKGGDPFMFGRGAEEIQALQAAGIAWRVIPGISAGIGGLEAAGVPVTHRDINQAVVFATGHDPDTDWAAISQAAPVIVIYMGLKRIGSIAAALMQAGRPGDTPVTLVSDASLPAQTLLATTLERVEQDLAASAITAPAIICIGMPVRLGPPHD